MSRVKSKILQAKNECFKSPECFAKWLIWSPFSPAIERQEGKSEITKVRAILSCLVSDL
ncbi:hypothetical protein MtrunA17_Chr8g0368601 [Medicago truncatula]|nr:hypothetical protein MtrunA17_Chr8g0368601 [Medicago truncatula]